MRFRTWASPFLPVIFAVACAAAPAKPATPTPTPRPDDVATIDGIVAAFYEVVNVAPDQPRQWDRDRTLYAPWIRFVAIGRADGDRARVDLWTHAELVAMTEPLVAQGFSERELHRVTLRYGNVAHVWSTYETVLGTASPARSRGVNSLDLYFDGARWWIASVMWQSEDAAHPIPPALLPAAP